jgi:two-component system cell cycle response regulator CpdR
MVLTVTNPPRRLRVVLVDDDAVQLELWRRVLERGGFEVTACADPFSGIRAIGEGCDCIITDHHMPGMTGTELIRACYRPAGPPFVVLTGSASSQVAQGALTAGASCVLTKPVEAQAVLDAVQWLCRRRPRPAQRDGFGERQRAFGA